MNSGLEEEEVELDDVSLEEIVENVPEVIQRPQRIRTPL